MSDKLTTLEIVRGRLANGLTIADSDIHKLVAEIERLRLACTKMNDEVCQRLGKALGYPWFKDDQENFPSATEESGVCTGDHVAETIAAEAARRIGNLEAERDRLREALDGVMNSHGEQLHDAFAVANATLKETRQ
jgi:hypothetical protein